MNFSSTSCSSSEFKSRSGLKNIPIGLIEDIISRLPAETVLDCKLVCRDWLNLIRHDLFPEKHLQYQLLHFHHFHNHKYYPNATDTDEVKTTKIGFIAGIDETAQDEYNMFYKEFNDRVITTKRINHDILCQAGDDMISSCNGLICIVKYIFNNPVLYICNPITRECVHLPEFAAASESTTNNQAFGFGYDAAYKKYKAVRIVYPEREKNDECVGLVQVYTLGIGSGWRDRGTIAHSLGNMNYGVLVDGALHWLGRNGQVWAFDLAGEKFSSLTKLPYSGDGVYHDQKLVVLGGWLSVVDIHSSGVDIWSFKKIKEESDLWSWSREFSIECDYDIFPLFVLTNMGELICLRNDGTIYLYGKDSELICELEEIPHPIIFGILHVNSFISLRALGERDVEVIESADRRRDETAN
ncbi:hypothetical protein MKW94_002035 [Papaver nudicaule]|uniref:F-box domain-containing protein n=1 Tax=Papaver nudicaule TaxID=74823 RepID=A0AA41VYH0_PAPNU|nr:hypothetical protein [Papaver nudicaule]